MLQIRDGVPSKRNHDSSKGREERANVGRLFATDRLHTWLWSLAKEDEWSDKRFILLISLTIR